MKTVYYTEKAFNIHKVFDPDATVYNRAYIVNHPEEFRDTEYMFTSWGVEAMTEDEIRRCLPKLKAVFHGAGTVQHFARPFLNCGVRVFSAWAANAIPVAEYTVAQIILANKGFYETMRFRNKEDARVIARRYPGNYGAKVGIIGAGMIGKLVIKMLKSYKLEVLAFDPFLPDKTAAELGVEKVSLERVFAECQVVSNHLADNAETKGMLRGSHFASMLPDATFLNTARGAQVVEGELIAVLKARPDLTAILDVTEPEPPLEGSELYDLPNCILTPHIAGSSGDEVKRMGQYMREQQRNVENGDPCQYEVTMEMLKTMA